MNNPTNSEDDHDQRVVRYHVFVHSSGKTVLDAMTIDSFLGQSDVAPITLYLVSDASSPIVDAPWRSSVVEITPEVLSAFVGQDSGCIAVGVKGGTVIRPGGLETVDAYFSGDQPADVVLAPIGMPADFDHGTPWVPGPVRSQLDVPISLNRIRRLAASPRDDFLIFTRTNADYAGTTATIGEFYFGHGRPRHGVSVAIPAKPEVPVAPERARPRINPIANTRPVWIFAERLGLLAEEGSWQLFDWVRKNRSDIEAYFVVDPSIPVPPADHLDAVVTKGTADWRAVTGAADVAFVTDSARDYLLRNQDRLDKDLTKHVYLTHGGLGYRPGVYQRNHGYFDLICCDSRHAARAAAEAWDFGASQFAPTGLARWDRLQSGFRRPIVLFSPTWRKVDDELERAKFIDTVLATASSPELNNALSDGGFQLALNMHFREAGLQDRLREELPDNVLLVEPDSLGPLGIRAILSDCAATITDYSSVFWDVVYRGQNAYLYQFDLREFLAERERPTFFLPAIQRYFDLSQTLPELVEQIARGVRTEFRLDSKRRLAWEDVISRPDGGHCNAICDEVERRFSSRRIPDPASHVAESVAALSFDDGSNLVGIVGNPPKSLKIESEFILLDSISTTEEPRLRQCDSVVVYPSLEGSSRWADVFFSSERTTTLLRDLINYCRGVDKKLTILRDPTYALDNEVDWPAANGVAYLTPPTIPPLASPRSESALVSVIVPTYNRSEQLFETVHSVLAQRGNIDFEIVIVDDGSSDGTRDLGAHLTRQDCRVRYLHQANRRQGAARNLGISAARGKYITFLDTGDLLHPEFLSETLITKHIDRADVVQGAVISHRYGTDEFWMGQSAHARFKAPGSFTLRTWPALVTDPFAVASLFDLEFLKRNSLFFPESFHEDEFFSSRVALSGARYVSTRRALYFYCDRNDGSGTANFTEAKFQQVLRIGISVATAYLAHAEDETASMKLAHLVGRYDRFLFKAQKIGTMPFTEPYTAHLLSSFLELVPEELIKRYAPSNPNSLLLFKLGFTKFGDLDERQAKEQLLSAGATDRTDYLAASADFAKHSSFDNYRRELLTFLKPDERTAGSEQAAIGTTSPDRTRLNHSK